jgi:glycosyltransferase involved in cell wall biosynthesis
MTRRERRVVIVADAKFPVHEPFAGGMQALTWHLAKGLKQRGISVSVFAAPGTDPELRAETLAVSELELSLASRNDVSMQPWEWMAQHHAYLSLMLRLSREMKSGIVHNNSLHHLPVAMAGMLQVPFLTTLHTPPTPWLEPAVRLSDAPHLNYVAVSDHTADAWACITPTKARVIPNGIDLRRWTPGPGGTGLVWSGRIVPEKGLHLAIDVAQLAGRHLRIAGPISDVGYWRQQVVPRLGGEVEYVGHLRQEELVDLVGHSAACLVTPLWDEPYGLVAAEALACGTPVLGFARGGLTQVVDDSCARLVHDDQPASVAALVPELEHLDRSSARQWAVENCSLDTMVEAYLDLYEESTAAEAA